KEDIRAAQPGDVVTIGAYDLRFEGVERLRGPNFITDKGTVTMIRDGVEVGTLHPEKRFYPVAGMSTTEAGIDYGITRDVYVSLGDQQEDGAWALRSYLKPFATWLWIGSAVMALGGILSLTDRRYRVGAAVRRRPAPSGAVPAE
ncbi:MAG: cytochrome c-type biogenesis CcmF C-terminal domain-containing protein, partial [Pseudomonadota bacterium]